MDHLEKRISYLRGLAEGMKINQTSQEGRLLVDMIGVMDDLCNEIKTVHTRVDECEDYVEAVDEDLNDLEYLLYDDDLYETVDDRDEHGYVLRDDETNEYYDLDDSVDSYVYEIRDTRDDVEFDTSYEFECPTCTEIIFLHEGTDHEGYRHYVIEPYHGDTEYEQEPINPT